MRLWSVFDVFRAHGTCLVAANVVLSPLLGEVNSARQIPSLDLRGQFAAGAREGKGGGRKRKVKDEETERVGWDKKDPPK